MLGYLLFFVILNEVWLYSNQVQALYDGSLVRLGPPYREPFWNAVV